MAIAKQRPAGGSAGCGGRRSRCTGSRLRIERPEVAAQQAPHPGRVLHVERLVEAQLARAGVAFTVASTDSAIMASMGSPGVRWSSANTPARDEEQHRDRRDQAAQDELATSRAAAALFQPHVLEPHHPVRDRLVALHPRAEGLRLDRDGR